MVFCFLLCGDDGSKIKSNLPGAGWRPVLKLVDPLSFLCAEQRKDANEPRHIVDANSISLALARSARSRPFRCISSSGANPLCSGCLFASSISLAPARKGQVSFIPLRLLSKLNPLRWASIWLFYISWLNDVMLERSRPSLHFISEKVPLKNPRNLLYCS